MVSGWLTTASFGWDCRGRRPAGRVRRAAGSSASSVCLPYAGSRSAGEIRGRCYCHRSSDRDHSLTARSFQSRGTQISFRNLRKLVCEATRRNFDPGIVCDCAEPANIDRSAVAACSRNDRSLNACSRGNTAGWRVPAEPADCVPVGVEGGGLLPRRNL
jgi:hypothetical protein